jgi:ubiquinol-cytochrome c reductase subunit 8
MSPYRQSAFRGVFSGYLFHGARRLAANAPYFVPPFAAGKPARAFPLSLSLLHSRRLILLCFRYSPSSYPFCFIIAGYAVYTWAKATDHYNNSKQAHVAALKSSGEHHGH